MMSNCGGSPAIPPCTKYNEANAHGQAKDRKHPHDDDERRQDGIEQFHCAVESDGSAQNAPAPPGQPVDPAPRTLSGHEADFEPPAAPR